MKLLFASLLLTSNVFAAHTGELLYKLKENIKSFQGVSLYYDEIASIYRPQNKNTDLNQVRKEMLASGNFEFVEFNTIEYQADNNDILFNRQWQHDNIETKLAWNISQGNAKTLVAVCDSGIESEHEDLKGNINSTLAWDFIGRDTDANPVTSHGTFVAGLIAAKANNSLGGAGVAPKVQIIPFRIANSEGGSSISTITQCIRRAADSGARVINVSFTGVNSSSVNSAGKYANSKGALLVYSAGNQGWDLPKWRDRKYVVAVGATNRTDNRWTYINEEGNLRGSNIGPFVDLVAPGASVVSTTTYIRHNPGSAKYRSGSGTSYSAPIVSAVAGLIFSINPKLTPRQVENILKNSCDQIGSKYNFGSGRVNAHEAVKLAQMTLR